MARRPDRPPSRAEVPFFHRTWVRFAFASTALVLGAMAVTVGSVMRTANEEIRRGVRQHNEQIARAAAGEIGDRVAAARGELERTAALMDIAGAGERLGLRPPVASVLPVSSLRCSL